MKLLSCKNQIIVGKMLCVCHVTLLHVTGHVM